MKFLLSLILIVCSGISYSQGLNLRQKDPIPAEVDAMYKRGLDYLSNNQNERGSWDDPMGNESGVVGLCLSAFLAYGTDPNHGPYAQPIRRCIDFLLENQSSENGYIGQSMYNHGFATAALAEAYGMVDEPRLGNSVRNAINLILSAQERNSRSAWRYTPDSRDADTTVTGCQVIALYAARNAGIPVPESAFKKAIRYFASCRGSNGGIGYVSPATPRVTLTAIGLLCQSLLKEKDSAGYRASLAYLKKNLDYRDKQYPYYFQYYMSQALFQSDEEAWREWNDKNIRLLSVTQNRNGFWDGASNKGPAFSTSAALLSLALNYRYLPVYEK